MARSKKVHEDQALLQIRSKDEMNLAEFPFCQLSNKSPRTKVIAFGYDSVESDGSITRREWRVEGGAECGLPRPIDEDVYVALMLLTTRQGFESQKVTFTIYELLEVLGWDKGGKSYSRIRASLRRLRNLSIEAANAFKDNRTKRYEKFLGFGIIDDYEINAGPVNEPSLPFPDDTEVPAGKSYIRWNSRLFRSFKDGYIKNLDHEFYRSLKSTISKRLYRFLDKKFYFGLEVVIDVLQLGYEHIGLSRQSAYPSKVWEKLSGGIAELMKRNYLASAERNGKNARFLRAEGPILYETGKQRSAKTASTEASLHLARLSKQFLREAIQEGVTESQAKRFLNRCNETELQRAIDLIAYFRLIILPRAKDRLDNPAGYLLTLLRDDSFEIPSAFISESRRNNANNYRASFASEKTIEQLQREIQYYQQLDKVGEEEFQKLSAEEQRKRVNLHITEMMLSKHRTTYQSWPKDLLKEHATYQVKRDLAGKLVQKP
jgi:hypothetical protein